MRITKNKKVWIGGLVSILLISLGGFYIWKQSQIEPTVVFKENLEFEYGDEIEFNVEQYIINDESNYDEISFDALTCEDAETKMISTEEVGSFKATVFATLKNKCVAFELPYTVIDTQHPILNNVKDIKVVEGDKVSFDSFTAEDIVDGTLDVEVVGDYDSKKAGTYNLKAVAKDKNGNETEEDFELVVDKKPEEVVVETKPNTGASSKPSNSNGTSSSKPSTGSNASSGGSTSSGSNNGSTTKPSNPKPETPKEDDSWKKHPKDFINTNGNKMWFYKSFATFDECNTLQYSEDFRYGTLWDMGMNGSYCDGGDLFIYE